MPSRPGGRARIEIDISSHEYCSGKIPVEVDGFTVLVYTPTMIACEKLRAICQQTQMYAEFVRKNRAPRARDFFDISTAVGRFHIDMLASENIQLLRRMFDAKRVPLTLLEKLEQDREFHRMDWPAVQETVDPMVRLRDFDSYFDEISDLARRVARAAIR